MHNDDTPASTRRKLQVVPSFDDPIVGTVCGVQIEFSGDGRITTETLRFRVEQFDAAGHLVRSVPVEMKGNVEVVIRDGDDVEIAGKYRPGRALTPTRLRNLRTGVTVKRNRWTLRAAIILAVVLGLILFAFSR